MLQISSVTANGFDHLKEEYPGDMDFGKIWKELSSAGCAPFEVVYGIRPNTPLDVNCLPLPPRPSEAALDFSSYMSKLHEECKRRLAISANSYAKAANSHRKDRQFNEGDMDIQPAMPLPENTSPRDEVAAILDHQFVSTRRGGYYKFLVQWKNRPQSESVWLQASELQRLHPHLFTTYLHHNLPESSSYD
ncbi:hypothetical protein SADUNF_Sadunf19G0111800 [Salix dunnii]|uniref:Chromo domain-containing protein n=1 Tax=Salix dunnii TaxID=1413687 RepID=A0A835MCY7_9ROSI|nr:hypothetical protein SADUNF_Sadunf19G0111800 [Salix dunnii]